MTLGDKTLEKFAGLRTWKQRGERAPHKPLLVLQALGRIQQRSERLQPFRELEPLLTRLLVEFGPARRSFHPELPFWHLQGDGIWEVTNVADLKRQAGKSRPLKSELLRAPAEGGFTEEIHKTLRTHPSILVAVAASILDSHFPATLHSSIANAVGLDLEVSVRENKRDAAFRYEILSAWGHQCGFCGYNLKLDNSDLGLEAAHLKWVQAGGPDVLANGIACCSLHHLAFDKGAVGIDEHLRVLISARLQPGVFFQDFFLQFQGKTLKLPSRRVAFPKREYLQWHLKEVFKGQPRD